MALPAMGANPRLLEQLRIGGGFGSLPDGGVDMDKAGRIAADGDCTVGGLLDARGGITNTTGAILTQAPLELRSSLRAGTGGVDKTWSAFLNPAQAMKPAASFPAGPTVQWNGLFNPAYTYLEFDRATRQYCTFALPMPADYDGAALKLVLLWTATGGTAGQTVVWRVRLGMAADNSDMTGVLADVGAALEDQLQTANRLHLATTVGGTPANPAPGGLLFVNIDRQADSASDTLNAEARLLGARLQYA